MKSPALDAAAAPLRKVQNETVAEYQLALNAYQAEVAEHEREFARWKKAKSNDPPPKKPDRPEPVRHIVNDTTVEALGSILEANVRGVVLLRDELSGWVRGFNQYKSGRGADAALWLEMHRVGEIAVDRKTGERKLICVPRAGVAEFDACLGRDEAERLAFGELWRGHVEVPMSTTGRW